MKRICDCGKVIKKGQRIITYHNQKGKLDFHICPHNVVLKDERKITMKNFLSGSLVSQEYIIK